MRQGIGRIIAVACLACMAMVIMQTTAVLAIDVGNKWLALGIALLLMVGAIMLFGHAEQRRPEKNSPMLWLLCYLLNSVANGFSVAAFYIHAAFSAAAAELLPCLLPAAALVFMAGALLACFPVRKKWILCFVGIGAAALLVMSFIPAVWPEGYHRSAVLFGSLVAIMYLVVYGVTIGRGARTVLRDIACGSFGALILVTFVVLLIISDGEALDGLDFDLDFPWWKRHKKM